MIPTLKNPENSRRPEKRTSRSYSKEVAEPAFFRKSRLIAPFGQLAFCFAEFSQNENKQCRKYLRAQLQGYPNANPANS